MTNANHDGSKVTFICSGSSGHQPGSTGFVGCSLLSMNVYGDVFASSSACRVYRARHCRVAIGALINRRVLAGTILSMTIYFILCCIVLTVFFFSRNKIIGTASEADWSFDAVLKLGQTVTGTIASIACTLDHCH